MIQIANPDNIRRAFIKARKGKTNTNSVMRFSDNLDNEVLKIYNVLTSGGFNLGNYFYFTIYDPKKRLICAAPFRERVIQHAIMNICHNDFEKHQIYHSYASRKEKGVYACLTQAQINHKKYHYYIKMDCRKYFDSIKHEVLRGQLRRLFKDELLLNLFFRYIDTYSSSKGKGLPIGNLLSQYFANHYLSVADHFAQNVLKVKMVRYMDDIVFWGSNATKLMNSAVLFKVYLRKELDLELKAFCTNTSKNELSFLGYLITKFNIGLAKKSRVRFIRNLKKLNKLFIKNKISEQCYAERTTALYAFIEKGSTVKYRNRIILMNNE